MHNSSKSVLALLATFLVGAAVAWANISGSISGIVTDPSSAVTFSSAIR